MLKAMLPIQSSEDGILTKLFRKMIIETGFINSINYFINRYKGNKSRTTLSRLIINGEMTWNSFTLLILVVLRAKELRFGVSIKHDGKTFSNHVTMVREEYKEKESGRALKQLFDGLVEKMKLNEKDLKELTRSYYKNGGKKNKATIGKILESEIISWKSFMFLMFELLNKDKIEISLDVKGVHGKTTTHDLIISKNN